MVSRLDLIQSKLNDLTPDFTKTKMNHNLKTQESLLLISMIFVLLSGCSNGQVDEKPIGSKFSHLSPVSDSLIIILSEFPPDDLPSEWDLLENCQLDAIDYYYGVDTRINYEKARCAAFREFSRDSNDSYQGSGILSMIYANGYGVDRNLDLAIMVESLTDQSGVAPVDYNEYLNNLINDRSSQSNYNHDRFCDGMGNPAIRSCIGYARQPDLFLRKVRLDNLIGVDEHLRLLIDQFTSVRQTNETLQWGGRSNDFWPNWHEEDFQDLFHIMAIELFNSGKFPNYTEEEFREMDQKLNHMYNNLRGNDRGYEEVNIDGMRLWTSSMDEYLCCSFEKIQKTQRVWLEYRDTWVEFGQRNYPKVDRWSWLGWLTSWRIWQLESMGTLPYGIYTYEDGILETFYIEEVRLNEQILLSLTYNGYMTHLIRGLYK